MEYRRSTYIYDMVEHDQDVVLMEIVRYLKKVEGFSGDELEFYKAITNAMCGRLSDLPYEILEKLKIKEKGRRV